MRARPILRRGDRGPSVEELQQLLAQQGAGLTKGEIDGVFGRRTEAAVKKAQRQLGLDPDGIVGAKTWRAFESAEARQNPAVSPGDARQPNGGANARPESRPPSSSSGEPRWLEIARAESGVAEDPRPGQHNRRILDYHATTSYRAQEDEVPWCSSFVNWCLRQASRPGTDSAAAKSWLEWGRELEAPRVGAIAVVRQRSAALDRATGSASGYHVAFWISQDASHVVLLGGNQSDRVKESRFALRSYDLVTMRWPV
jgi:uncharacterized protein (TIGR02594 family)